MTDLLYREAPYDREFEATVARALDDRVALDRTLFYPEGGGQPTDEGLLRDAEREWRVTDVTKTDTIYHRLTPVEESDDGETGGSDREDVAGEHGGSGSDPELPEAGTTVAGALDWERRYAHMRYHTAQHLLSALLLSEYDAATTGNQLYADRARIDVGYDRFDEADLAAIEKRMNALVSDALPVAWYEMDRERAEAELDPERTRLSLLPASITEVRIVEIDGYDRTACAGTHVRNTEEIGEVRITGRETRGEDEERLRFVLDS